MLWACDFLTKKVWTVSGLVEYYVFFFVLDRNTKFTAGFKAQQSAIAYQTLYRAGGYAVRDSDGSRGATASRARSLDRLRPGHCLPENQEGCNVTMLGGLL
jgi:hypothetical protein